MFKRLFFLCFCTTVVLVAGCNVDRAGRRVVLYCSVDDVYARPLIERLEKETGLFIDTIYDTEATKTAGLANKIRAEKERPRADVFWSSALLQTLLMSEEGLLQAHEKTDLEGLPKEYVERDWVGVGVRGRVLAASQRNASPRALSALPEGTLAHSNPQFGTASDEATAWASRKGQKWLFDWFREFEQENGRILPGNGDVARAVGDGQIQFGWTDTDDFLAQKREGKPIFVVRTTKDNVLVPGAVSILKNAPHPENARKLFDAIVSAQNEAALAQQMPGVFSLRKMEQKSNWRSGGVDFSFLQTAPRDEYAQWPQTWREIREPLNDLLKP